VNVAVRLISLCPPAFPPIHFAPRTQTVRKSSFARRPTASNPISKFPCCRPFVFMVLRIAFPANPLYSKTSSLPPGVPPKPLFRRTTTSTCRPRPPIPFIINQLRTLVLSCGSFPHSHPLFSTACRLFVQKHGSGVPRVPLHPEISAQLGLCALCVLCGASGFPALSFPSFGGPKNADAR